MGGLAPPSSLQPPRPCLNRLAAHFVHRGNLKRRTGGYAARMSSEISRKTAVADEFETRAATFRRIAGEMKDGDDRAELLRIASSYEEDAARLRQAAPGRA